MLALICKGQEILLKRLRVGARIPPLAKSLRAGRPSGQPARRPALRSGRRYGGLARWRGGPGRLFRRGGRGCLRLQKFLRSRDCTSRRRLRRCGVCRRLRGRRLRVPPRPSLPNQYSMCAGGWRLFGGARREEMRKERGRGRVWRVSALRCGRGECPG
jgi:hypothetical protein